MDGKSRLTEITEPRFVRNWGDINVKRSKEIWGF